MPQDQIPNARSLFELLQKHPEVRIELRNHFVTDRKFIQWFGIDYNLGHGNVLYRLPRAKDV